MKNQRGVTLVALVVTIIILIVLAGLSINLLLGDNGIITKAKEAKENTELAKIEEEKSLNEFYTQLETGESSSGGTDYDSIAKLTEFKRKIAQGITNEGVSTSADATAETMVENIGKILQIRTADATATAGEILSGQTAWVNGSKITGTMENRGELNWSSSENETYSVPSGYYSGGTLRGVNAESTKAMVFTTFPVDMKQYTDKYTELKASDFIAGCTGAKVSGNVYATGCASNFSNSSAFSISVSYDNSTGVLKCGGSTSTSFNVGQGDGKASGSATGIFIVWKGTIDGK